MPVKFLKLEPGADICYSDGWFRRLKKRFGVSFRRATNSCQRNLKINDLHFDFMHPSAELQKRGKKWDLLGNGPDTIAIHFL